MASTRYRNSLKSWAPFAGSQEGPALVDKGGTATNLGLCEGDCDRDGDCQGALRCFQRDSRSERVPGCTPGGTGDTYEDRDYCYMPTCPNGQYKNSATTCKAKTPTCGPGTFFTAGKDSEKTKDDTNCNPCGNGKYKTGTSTATQCASKKTSCGPGTCFTAGKDSEKTQDDTSCNLDTLPPVIKVLRGVSDTADSTTFTFDVSSDLAEAVNASMGYPRSVGRRIGITATAIDALDGALGVTEDWSKVAAFFDARKTSGSDGVTVFYTAQDYAGNIQNSTRRVVLVDRTPPTITLNQSSPYEVNINKSVPRFIGPDAHAHDIVDGDVSKKISVHGNKRIRMGTFGDYNVTYSVADASNNTAVPFVLEVAVVDREPPVIVLRSNFSCKDGKWHDAGAHIANDLVCHSHNFGVPWADPGYALADNHLNSTQLENRLRVVVSDHSGNVSSGLQPKDLPFVELGSVLNVVYAVSDVDATGQSLNQARPQTRRVTIVDTLPPVLNLTGEATEYIRVGGGTSLADGTTAQYEDRGVTFQDLHLWPRTPQTVEDVDSLAAISDDPVPGVIYRTGLREAQGLLQGGGGSPPTAAAADMAQFPVAGKFKVNYTVFDQSKNMGTITRLLVVQPAAENSSSSIDVIVGSVLTVLALCIIG